MTFAHAVGAGTLVNVLVAMVARLLGLIGVPQPVRGDVVILAVAAAIVVALHGQAARRDVALLGLLGLAAPAATVLNRILSVAFIGRGPEGGIDAFAGMGTAILAVTAALVIGAAIGAIARAYAFAPRLPWQPPRALLHAVGVAFVAGAIAALVWPGPFLTILVARTSLELSVELIALPLVLAGPVIGGIDGARGGLSYLTLLIVGCYVALPAAWDQVASTASLGAHLGDAGLAAVAGQLRGAIARRWLLVALRIAAWPLGAAFARGFLSEPTRQP